MKGRDHCDVDLKHDQVVEEWKHHTVDMALSSMLWRMRICVHIRLTKHARALDLKYINIHLNLNMKHFIVMRLKVAII